MNVFLGSYDEVLRVADEIVGIDLVVAEDKPSSLPVQAYCAERGKECRVLGPRGEIREIFPERAELALLASFGRILRRDALDRCGLALNFHPGVITQCRGKHPLPQAILARHAMMGVTCHRIDSEAVDAGPIVGLIQAPIDYEASYASNDARLRGLLEPLARAVLTEYARTGAALAAAWEPAEGSYFPPLPAEDLRRVTSSGRLKDLFECEIHDENRH